MPIIFPGFDLDSKDIHAYRTQDQRRLADAIGCVVPVAKIATGEQSETVEKPRPYLTLPYGSFRKKSRAVVQKKR